MRTFVYRITNKINGKVYYGKAVDVGARWYQHCWNAAHGKNSLLHRALRKYGPVEFRVETLSWHRTNEAACCRERQLIRRADPFRCYNVARGGDGGVTLTAEQIDAQRAIPSTKHSEFEALFNRGWSAARLAKHFDVGPSSVNRCAERLGLSFIQRQREGRTQRLLPPKRPKKPRKPYERKFKTPEEYSAFRSEVATRAGKARGPGLKAQRRALMLYFEKHLTAQEVADQLGLTKGSVRGLVNREYASLSEEERRRRKSVHGRKVRMGERNSNYIDGRRCRTPRHVI